MTVPVETLAQALAVATHRGRARPAVRGFQEHPTWHELGVDARHLALGLVDDGLEPGTVVALSGPPGPARVAAELAVMAAGAATGPASDASRHLDVDTALDPLRQRGRKLDDAQPSRFEELVASVSADDVATVAGGHRLTHRTILWSVRSLVRWLDAGDQERLLVRVGGDQPDGEGVAARVVGPYLATVLGAELWFEEGDARPTAVFGGAAHWESLAAQVAAGGAGALRVRRAVAAGDPLTLVESIRSPFARRTMRAARNGLGVGACRAFVCVGPLPSPGARRELAAAGIEVLASWGHPACGGLAAIGNPPCPMPGMTLGIDDDGRVAVRAAVAAAGAAEGGGWLRTDQPGRLDERGALHLDGGP